MTLTAESEQFRRDLGMLAFGLVNPTTEGRTNAMVSERLAAIEAAAVKRALSPERLARALHDGEVGCSWSFVTAEGERFARPVRDCEADDHADHAAQLIAALEAQP